MAMIKIPDELYDTIKVDATKRGIYGATSLIRQLLYAHYDNQVNADTPKPPVPHVSSNETPVFRDENLDLIWPDESNI